MAKTLIEWTWRRLPSTALSAQQLCTALKLGAHIEAGTVVLPGFTFNPWIGCAKVSPGCANCYAAAMDERRFSRTLGGATKERPVIHFGKGAPRHRTSEANWRAPLQWNRKAQELGVTLRVFSASLGDWLDDEVPVEWLADLLGLIHETPHLDWLLLTKRPQMWELRCAEVAQSAFPDRLPRIGANLANNWFGGEEAPANVWIGTTVEDQQRADERIPALLNIPARVRFLSCEPLLGPVKLPIGRVMTGFPQHITAAGKAVGAPLAIHWVIAGGESGPHARPMHPEWARSLRDQCAAAGVPFYFKQWGEHRAEIRSGVECVLADLGPNQSAAFGDGKTNHVIYTRVGKASAGKIIDGREHHATPEPRLRADDAHKSALPVISSLTK